MEPDHTLIDKLGEEVRQFMPERLQNDEKAGYRFGSLCGWFGGVFLGSQLANWLWPREEE